LPFSFNNIIIIHQIKKKFSLSHTLLAYSYSETNSSNMSSLKFMLSPYYRSYYINHTLFSTSWDVKKDDSFIDKMKPHKFVTPHSKERDSMQNRIL
jgi:hypothetical protein